MAVALVVVACTTTAPPAALDLPDPLLGPVPGEPLSGSTAKAARAVLRAVQEGRFSRAEARLARIPADHPVRALLGLEVGYAQGESVAAPAHEVAQRWENYASAWHLAALAASKESDLRGALVAARRAVGLRESAELVALATQLEAGFVAQTMSRGRSLLASGDAAGAERTAQEVQELVPGTADAAYLEVRAVLAQGEHARAAMRVASLPETPEALELAGRVAEAQGQWELALDLYRRLPGHHPGRCDLVRGAWEQWRVTVMPAHVARALKAKRLTRSGLASIVAWEAPGVAEKAAGAVPVFEDVVGLPEGNEIIAVARAGVLVGDTVARRFGPDHRVSAEELIRTLERLATLLGSPVPQWCGEPPGGDCRPAPSDLSGAAVAVLVRTIAGEEEASRCSRN